MYEGQILTGMPEAADQFSGLRLRAVFAIQLRTGVDIFQVNNILHSKFVKLECQNCNRLNMFRLEK